MRLKLFGRRPLRAIRRLLVAGALMGIANVSLADEEYASAWGPAVGSMAPLLAAEDQHGNQQTVASLTGTSGFLFVFNRSVDW